jgi:type IV secretion system protein VirD4
MSWHLLAGVGLFAVAALGIRFADRGGPQRGARRDQQGFGHSGFGLPDFGLPGFGGRGPADPARWAQRVDLRALVVPRPTPGRVVIGISRNRLIAAERGHSLLVVGPTQSGKTTGLAAPAITEWDGPVVAASVKGDLARLTIEARSKSGGVHVYDPLGTTGLQRSAWSPLGSCRTWTDARRVAADLAGVARDGASTMSDGDFWYSMAAKLLGPLFLAAAHNGIRMSEVLRWVDEADLGEALNLLTIAGEELAVQALHATLGRDDRQRSAVFTTAETVIEAFADPDVAACESIGLAAPKSIDAAALLDGNQTLYVCAPPHDQRRLRPLFATLVSQVISEAYRRAMASGHALDPPLLVVLDEAANVAPLTELDVLASTAAGHGVQLVTVWQDLAQLHARYGQRAPSVVNNQRAKLFLTGIADPGTLEHVSQLAGDEDRIVRSSTIDGYGSHSTTEGPAPRRLIPPDALRRMRPGTGVLLYAHLPPVRVSMRRAPSTKKTKTSKRSRR